MLNCTGLKLYGSKTGNAELQHIYIEAASTELLSQMLDIFIHSMNMYNMEWDSIITLIKLWAISESTCYRFLTQINQGSSLYAHSYSLFMHNRVADCIQKSQQKHTMNNDIYQNTYRQKQIQFAKPYKICYCFFCWYTFEMQSKKRFNKKVQFRTGVGMWNHQSTHICVHHICVYLAVSSGRSLQYPTNITHISINKARYAFSGNHRIKF